MIKIRGLHKSFPKSLIPYRPKPVEVLRGIDFDASPGSITGIMGKNGAGKTTLFRIISGIEAPTSGELMVLNESINDAKSARKIRGRIALLPEEPGLNNHETAEYHLHLYGVMMGLSYHDTAHRLKALNERLHMESYWRRPYRDYSKGQKAKISLARMLMMPHAEVLIFDEPTNGLDFETAAIARSLIKEAAQSGKTILLASHIVSEMLLLCDRIVGLDGGKMVYSGSLFDEIDTHIDLYASAKNLFKTSPLIEIVPTSE